MADGVLRGWQTVHAETVTPWEVIHFSLWIAKVIHALTLAPRRVVHALTLALLRINSRAPISTCSSPVSKALVCEAYLLGTTLRVDTHPVRQRSPGIEKIK